MFLSNVSGLTGRCMLNIKLSPVSVRVVVSHALKSRTFEVFSLTMRLLSDKVLHDTNRIQRFVSQLE
jgi:hypothetical protein